MSERRQHFADNDPRLQALVKRYLDLDRQVTVAMSDLSGAGRLIDTDFLGDQIAAAARLAARLREIDGAIQSTQTESEGLQRQRTHSRKKLELRKQQVVRLRTARALWDSWQQQQQTALAMHEDVVKRLRNETEQIAATIPSGLEDDTIAQLIKLRDSLRACNKVIAQSGQHELREQLKQLAQLKRRLQNEYEVSRSDYEYKHATLNEQRLAHELDLTDDVATMLESKLEELFWKVDVARSEFEEADFVAEVAQADLPAKKRYDEWINGEIIARQAWAEHMRTWTKLSNKRLENLQQELSRTEGETLDTDTELMGRESELRWVEGEIAGQRVWAALRLD